MSRGQRRQGARVFEWILGMMLFTGTAVAAKDEHVKDPFRRGVVTLHLALRCPAAMRAARARYRFLRRLESRLHFRLYEGEAGHQAVLFPLSRSDRAYVMLLPWYDGEDKPHYRVDCYEREHGRDKLLYSILLERQDRVVTKDRPAKAASRIGSLLDFLTSERPVLEGVGLAPSVLHAVSFPPKLPISHSAASDLAAPRQYVEYDYHIGVDAIEVSLIAERFRKDYSGGEQYGQSQDPLTGAPLRYGEFYKRYGLPVAMGELPLLCGSSRPADSWQQLTAQASGSPLRVTLTRGDLSQAVYSVAQAAYVAQTAGVLNTALTKRLKPHRACWSSTAPRLGTWRHMGEDREGGGIGCGAHRRSAVRRRRASCSRGGANHADLHHLRGLR